MFDLTIDTSGLEAEWEIALQKFQADLYEAVKEAAKQGADTARNSRIYQDRTAQLTASIGSGEFIITPNGAECILFAYETYASYVNEWEAQQLPDGFMDRGREKAEEVLEFLLNQIVRNTESRMNYSNG